MAQNQNANPNNGYLIKNEKKNDRQPDYRGKITIDGKEWSLSVWARGQRDGKDYFTLVASDPASIPGANKGQGNQNNQNHGNQSRASQGQSYPSNQQGQQSGQSQSGQHQDHVVDDEFGSVFDGLP